MGSCLRIEGSIHTELFILRVTGVRGENKTDRPFQSPISSSRVKCPDYRDAKEVDDAGHM